MVINSQILAAYTNDDNKFDEIQYLSYTEEIGLLSTSPFNTRYIELEATTDTNVYFTAFFE